jgi:hypothetical protein
MSYRAGGQQHDMQFERLDELDPKLMVFRIRTRGAPERTLILGETPFCLAEGAWICASRRRHARVCVSINPAMRAILEWSDA